MRCYAKRVIISEGAEGMQSRALHYMDEEERLNLYDRLATKWAQKMEAQIRHKNRKLSANKKLQI